MTRLMFGLGAACALSGCGSPEPHPTDIERSVMVADRFQSKLKSDLQTALQSGGPELGVAVCAEAAPAIANQVSAETGVDVRRISLRPRNPSAAVRGELRQKLEHLAERPLDANGRPTMISWVGSNGTTSMHYSMRAVVMQDQPCAMCHGTAIAPNVRAAIAQRYRQDQATGFRAGELRGAILVSMPQNGRKISGDTQ